MLKALCRANFDKVHFIDFKVNFIYFNFILSRRFIDLKLKFIKIKFDFTGQLEN